jgi:putative transposase
MARLPRYFIPGCPQHIILRGNNRQAIFAADADLRFWRDCLVEAAARFGLAIHAYVWMTNHVHLLASPGDAHSLPKTLQSAGRRYVQYFNSTYGRTGTLFEGRYRATVVDSERYLLTCRQKWGQTRLICSQGLGAGGFALCARSRRTGAAQDGLARAWTTSERTGARG